MIFTTLPELHSLLLKIHGWKMIHVLLTSPILRFQPLSFSFFFLTPCTALAIQHVAVSNKNLSYTYFPQTNSEHRKKTSTFRVALQNSFVTVVDFSPNSVQFKQRESTSIFLPKNKFQCSNLPGVQFLFGKNEAIQFLLGQILVLKVGPCHCFIIDMLIQITTICLVTVFFPSWVSTVRFVDHVLRFSIPETSPKWCGGPCDRILSSISDSIWREKG